MLAGILFMGSTEEQLGYLSILDVDVMSYINILLSFGFIVFVLAFSLIYLWESLTNYPNSPQTNRGYTEVVNDRETVLDASSAFLDDDEEDDFSNDSHHEAVELKDTSRLNAPRNAMM